MKENAAFELVQTREIAEFNTQGFLYRHRQTGAQLLSLVNDDENKVFGVTLRTPPTDSTGIAHILEHSVLCGSEKYPVKEPFVEMLKGSLKTFLNAFTYPDRTCYPVASTNLQDFYNLVDVYLDAVFNPRLTPQVLQQEGWHYELEKPDDPLVYKGVVFNEMKGAYSAPERTLFETAQQSLFPDNTYGVESGGHPKSIPDLTFEQFERFHTDLYHPSNARIFFYGDDDPAKRFGLVEEYLNRYEWQDVDSAISTQQPLNSPKTVEATYAASDGDDGSKSMVAVNWLLHGDFDAETGLALQILDHILIGTPASPLRKALIDSGLGEDLAGGGMETELKQFLFSIGLRGVEAGHEEAVEALVLKTIQELGDGGIEPQTVQAAINTSEFRLRENNTGSYPRGLVLMLRSLTSWLYDKDPFEPLVFEAPLQAVKRLAQNEGYFPGLVRRHLVENKHRTTVLLRPDVEQASREQGEERERLESVRNQMSASDVDDVIAQTLELKRRQEAPDSPQDLAKLPRLKLEDLETQIRTVPIDVVEQEGARVLYHDLFTNGIAYVDVSFDFRTVPQDLLPYLSLFGRALTEIGTSSENFVQLSQRIGSHTGGVWASLFVSSQKNDSRAVTRLFIRGKAMRSQVDDMLAIMGDVLLDVNLNNRDRFKQMALEEKAGEEASLVPGGHAVVSTRLRSQFDETGWLSEHIEGINYLFFLRRLVDEIDNDWSGVLAKLEHLRTCVINSNTALCNVTMADTDRGAFAGKLSSLLSRLPRGPVEFAEWRPQLRAVEEGLVIPAQVNYVAKAANLYDLGYQLHGSVGVVTRFLRNTWLWDRVRVQGGAYGAFCAFDHFSGVMAFASYRDPNVAGTVDIYDDSAQFLKDLDLSDDELTKAIIGTIGELDAYQLPDAKGYTSMVRYLTGITDEFRQQMRDAVLSTTAQDFVDFAGILDAARAPGRVVAMGSQDALEAANDSRGGDWLDLVRVL
jgi:Zn-dependent M16 (insulinase) family peptidase